LTAERLQKILARTGYGSRRSAEALIKAGRVTVDGRTASLGESADPESQHIAVDGIRITLTDAAATYVLNKPSGVVVTASDERGRRTIYDLLADVLPDAPANLRYVGRLDRDTEGLLILTTDGELAHRLAHPRYEVLKVYEAFVDGVPDRGDLERLSSGVMLDGVLTAPAEVALLDVLPGRANSRIRVALHEGRKRQVRRMLQAVGHPVRQLRRVELGGLRLGRLRPGEIRPLTRAEEGHLRTLVGLDAPTRATI